jgi:hypothetical protein
MILPTLPLFPPSPPPPSQHVPPKYVTPQLRTSSTSPSPPLALGPGPSESGHLSQALRVEMERAFAKFTHLEKFFSEKSFLLGAHCLMQGHSPNLSRHINSGDHWCSTDRLWALQGGRNQGAAQGADT